ncbi:hypothetical protein RUM44_010822 [Polyplax serrata]|uniref:CUB domain-containing protein n=1 Tax=Polyplax serrata TaxID=468196 RepID=A0ABR1AN95_POLSC
MSLKYSSFSHFIVPLFLTEFVLAKKSLLDLPCGRTDLKDSRGIISSPPEPFNYPNDIKCSWKVHSPVNSMIELRVVDLDMVEDPPCPKRPCCGREWLLLPDKDGEESQFFCGNYTISKPIIVSQPVLSIKYFSSNSTSRRDKRGFKITYEIKELNCTSLSKVRCMNGKCVSKNNLCNGIDDCGDGSDERNCSHRAVSKKYEFLPRRILDVNHHMYDNCIDGRKPCKSSPDHCYSPMDLCDGEFHCPNGEDEVGCTVECPNQIACSSGGCYYPSQRCNYKRNCRDNSDETGCPPEPCMALQFTCLNGACVHGSALCDGDDDCGDLSDEENCTKSSFMTAAIMGLFSCIFLFCIGLSCLYRVYTSRLRASAGFAHQLESEPIDDEFIYREPPPAYSVAIGESGIITYPAPEFMDQYFEPDPYPHQTRNIRHNRQRYRTGRGFEHTTTPRSRPRPSSGLTVVGNSSISQFPGVSTQPKVFDGSNKADPTSSRTNFEGVIQLVGFPEAVTLSQETGIQGAFHTSSPCSSPSLSPSRESMTSSTSLDDQEELAESCQS